MKFHTSYYANYRNIPSTYMCIGISRSCPEGMADGAHTNFTWVRDSFLAPSEETLREHKAGRITKEEYCEQYIARLEAGLERFGGLDGWISKVSQAYQTYDAVVFMCYEKPDGFCHRKILSGILNQLGIGCSELDVPRPDRSNDSPPGESVPLF